MIYSGFESRWHRPQEVVDMDPHQNRTSWGCAIYSETTVFQLSHPFRPNPGPPAEDPLVAPFLSAGAIGGVGNVAWPQWAASASCGSAVTGCEDVKKNTKVFRVDGAIPRVDGGLDGPPSKRRVFGLCHLYTLKPL